MNSIALLDPALKNNAGEPSINLGDLIISESVTKILTQLFPTSEINHISSHSPLEKKHFEIIKRSEFAFVGGTNLFTSDVYNGYVQLPLKRDRRFRWIMPGVKDLIYFGVGWGVGYKTKISLRTKIFYNKILNHRYLHSSRDSYSAKKMEGLVKIVNTSCPTVWSLDKREINRTKKNDICLMTLTDYSKSILNDSKLIEDCLEYFSQIVFFPQGTGDMDYINSLDVYKKNKIRFRLLPHAIKEYYNFVDNEEYTYVGTRLHGGIRCLQAGRNAAIIGIDNRSIEMSADIGLPLINRGDSLTLHKWLKGEDIFKPIHLPNDNIEKWKAQFH